MSQQIKVTVEGNGVFQIGIDKLGELLTWLSKNRAVAIQENNTIREVNKDGTGFTGRELLNG